MNNRWALKRLGLVILSVWVLMLSACSFSTEAPDWRMKSVKAFEEYQQLYLSNDTRLAGVALQQSVFYAKKSADFSVLAGVYLGECALHRAVLLYDDCEDYQSVANLTDAHQAYYALLDGQLMVDQMNQLPKVYQDFAGFQLNGETAKAEQALLAMDKLSSQLIGASLIHQDLSAETIRTLIDRASKKGYQKAVMAWLVYLQKITDSENEKQRIEQTLRIMQSPAK